jgi:protocatechuate 3,4-dioxygenase beta subunit
LPVGKYKVTPEKVYGYKFSDEKSSSVEIEIEAKSHTEQDFDFSIDNAIHGKVFDTSGKLLENVCLDLIPARGKKAPYFYQGDCTDENGRFEFDEIPAGTYVVVINEEGKITSNEPFGTFYYPNTTNRAEAAEITIGAGDFREDLIINAPQTAETVTISGTLLSENGKSVFDEAVEFFAEIEGRKERDRYTQADARAKTNKDGSFTIKILKGQKGKLFGSMNTYVGEYENCSKLDKLIRAEGNSVEDIETPSISIEAINNLSGFELKFPFPSCKKAKIE